MRFWQDYTADVLGGIAFGLSHMGDKNSTDEFKPYSEYAHEPPKKRKTKKMTYQQIVDYVIDRI